MALRAAAQAALSVAAAQAALSVAAPCPASSLWLQGMGLAEE